MRILLPPSEAKRTGGTGRPLNELGFARTGVGRHRERLCRATVRTAQGQAATANAAFALPPAVAAAAIAANQVVLESPTTPALGRYAGAVYEALDVRSLDPGSYALAMVAVLIFSGLFGVLEARDPIPDYRVPAAATLPRIGPVGRSWRPVLAAWLPELLAGATTIDLRSTDYQAMWRADEVVGVVGVRMLSRRPDGRLGVTSFFSKRGKGRLARALVEQRALGHIVGSAADVADAWRDAGLGGVAGIVTRPSGASSVQLVTAD